MYPICKCLIILNVRNGWPGIGELRSTAASNSVIQSYLDGDFTSIIKKLSSHPSDGIAYLALISKASHCYETDIHCKLKILSLNS